MACITVPLAVIGSTIGDAGAAIGTALGIGGDAAAAAIPAAVDVTPMVAGLGGDAAAAAIPAAVADAAGTALPPELVNIVGPLAAPATASAVDPALLAAGAAGTGGALSLASEAATPIEATPASVQPAPPASTDIPSSVDVTPSQITGQMAPASGSSSIWDSLGLGGLGQYLNPIADVTGAASSLGNALGLTSGAGAAVPGATDAASQAVNDANASANYGSSGVPGGLQDVSGSSGALTQASAGAAKGVSNTALTLGALAALGSALGRPNVPGAGTIPGKSSTAATQGPLFNQPLMTGGALTRAAVPNYRPSTGSFYTYGQQAEPPFFSDNQLTFPAFSSNGFAHGGALSRRVVSSQNGDHFVRGPGTGTSDSIPARLSDGEYILTAADVARIGHGSNEAGARKLDRERGRLSRGGAARPARGRGFLARAASQ